MTRCARCRRQTDITIMSMFNEDIVCLDCKDIEEKHPDYTRARDVEHQAVLAGDYKFPGVGLPADFNPRR